VNKPTCPAIEELEAILKDIAEMEDAIADLKERVRGIPAKMATEL